MSTSTATLTESSHSSRQISSISSLHASQTSKSTNIARVYKSASQLFVTRRIQEALDTLEPVIQRPETSSGDELDGDKFAAHNEESPEQQLAPIATASRGARVKVWSLYISIVNEVVEMGSEAGKKAFGAARWKQYQTKVRDGGIWAEVVEVGYSGIDGEVDAEVVANLSVCPFYASLTQQRLETYLSASSAPALDVSAHMERSQTRSPIRSNGTSTPRDLNSRLKILEIYTLHVLPRNAEWEYAREFISMSEILDEERREAFLQALQNIQDEKDFDSKREEELQRQREQQLEDARRRDAEAQRAQQTRVAEDRSQERPANDRNNSTENDYGIDSTRIGSQGKPTRRQANCTASSTRPVSSSRFPQSKPGRSGAPARRPPPSSVFARFGFVVQTLQNGVVSMGQNVRSHPALLFRVLAFIMALLMALSRRDIRDRLRRARDASWEKLKTTVGMGMKVSYI
ncbi:MAG: hypothetical protein Q9162_007856 [Coniocarpon cinnabarinum]